MGPSLWQEPPPRPVLEPGAVHVWRYTLDPDPAALAVLRHRLDAAECERAARFRAGALRDRFTAGRGGLRTLLGFYLGAEPAAVRFAYGPNGKPALAEPHTHLEFNLSHSHGLALLALTLGRPIGVDVETARAVELGDRIIERFFSVAERAEFHATPPEARRDAFLRGWTRKEAFIKAVGAGLTLPLDSFDVTLSAADPRLLRVGDDPEEAARWTLGDLPADPGDAAAYVVRGAVAGLSLYCFDLSRPAPPP